MIKLDGVLNILKPPGMTSHDVVSFLRRQLQTKKVGHAGTLDPQAAGVLAVCVGQGTRLIEYLTEHDKEYLCEMVLGISTTTQDAWGELVSQKDAGHITLAMIEAQLPRFSGTILQTAPAFSAVKVQGVPLYKKARQGQEVTPVVRQVQVHKIEILSFVPPKLMMRIHCSKGTYVRTICHDLGEALQVGGHMSFLLRTRVGAFGLEDSLTLEELASLKEKSLLPLEYCVRDLPQVVLSPPDLARIKRGQKVSLAQAVADLVVKPDTAARNLAVFDEQGKLQAIAVVIGNKDKTELQPKKVLNRL